jgi:hypothetical protein
MRYYVITLRTPDGSVIFQARVPALALEPTLATATALMRTEVAPRLNVQSGPAVLEVIGS